MAQRMDSIIFYRSFYEALQCITDTAERGFMYDSIMAYAFDGIEPQDLTPLQNMAFTLIKPQLDANVKKSEAGKRGGRPRKETTENEKPQVSEEKTIGFENENHRFLKTQTNKNNKSNKNSEYEYVSSNENKNSNLSHDIPTTTDIISKLKTTYYMTDSEAADVSNAFIDFNSGRNWSSLETRSWQSLLKQFVARDKDKRFTDDILSARKAEAEAEQKRIQAGYVSELSETELDELTADYGFEHYGENETIDEARKIWMNVNRREEQSRWMFLPEDAELTTHNGRKCLRTLSNYYYADGTSEPDEEHQAFLDKLQ